ncbi:hypothetical protein DIPPA_12516 [Diplonema papillatum]|nr:hypothetical protein DIPPA_12516 [Diplonema papillatum]
MASQAPRERSAAPKILRECTICGRFLLDMAHDGTAFTDSLPVRRCAEPPVRLHCPGCQVTHSDWVATRMLNHEGIHRELARTAEKGADETSDLGDADIEQQMPRKGKKLERTVLQNMLRQSDSLKKWTVEKRLRTGDERSSRHSQVSYVSHRRSETASRLRSIGFGGDDPAALSIDSASTFVDWDHAGEDQFSESLSAVSQGLVRSTHYSLKPPDRGGDHPCEYDRILPSYTGWCRGFGRGPCSTDCLSHNRYNTTRMKRSRALEPQRQASGN